VGEDEKIPNTEDDAQARKEAETKEGETTQVEAHAEGAEAQPPVVPEG